MYCYYYQAHVVPKYCWMLTATLRSFENVVFDRTIDVKNSIFEFFVPEGQEEIFLEIMDSFKAQNLIKDLKKLDNRLKQPGQDF